MNRFVRDLETGRLELRFDRAIYVALSAEGKAELKRVCLWSKSRTAWVSRATRNTWQAEQLAVRLGLPDGGTVGEKPTFAEKQEQKAEKAEARAERMEDRAERATDEADARHQAADQIASFIPPGQPILVGHHSEKRHRRDLEKIDNHMRKGCEAREKSKHYHRRAEAARRTADRAQLASPAFLDRRIQEREAELRLIRRRADKYSDSKAYLLRLAAWEEEVRDELSFYRECMDGCGGIRFSRENVKVGDHVKIRHGWSVVLRANPSTVTVRIAEGGAAGMEGKYRYAEIEEIEEIEELQHGT